MEKPKKLIVWFCVSIIFNVVFIIYKRGSSFLDKVKYFWNKIMSCGCNKLFTISLNIIVIILLIFLLLYIRKKIKFFTSILEYSNKIIENRELAMILKLIIIILGVIFSLSIIRVEDNQYNNLSLGLALVSIGFSIKIEEKGEETKDEIDNEKNNEKEKNNKEEVKTE